MKKIYYWSPTPVHTFTAEYDKYFQLDKPVVSALHIATGFAYLNSYIRRNREDLYQQVEWSVLDFLYRDAEYVADIINQHDIDILLISVYIWNQDRVFKSLKQIKQLCKRPLTIIVGGPSVDPHRNRDYLLDYPDVDYAVYGPGEIAFTNVLDEIINNKPLSLLTSKNCSWRSDKGIKIADYEFVRDPNCSPIVDSEDLFKKIVDDPEYKDYELVMPYETSKGCPYKCSFCDWGSGLSHKVYHRKWTWEDELDVLGRLGITGMHFADANFGMHKQDWDIAQCLVRLKKEKGYNWRIYTVNFSKLNKKQVFKIAELLYINHIYTATKFSLQDINPAVLENIDRPDVPWPEHKQMIDEMWQKYPNMVPRVEIIQGLPGQTRETWEQTLLELSSYFNYIFVWYMLPNSPGATKEYRDRWGIKTLIGACPLNGHLTEIVVETNTYNFTDYCYFTLLRDVARHPVLQMNPQKKQIFELIKKDPNLDTILETIKGYLVDQDQTKTVYNISHTVGLYLDKLIVANRDILGTALAKDWLKHKLSKTKDLVSQ